MGRVLRGGGGPRLGSSALPCPHACPSPHVRPCPAYTGPRTVQTAIENIEEDAYQRQQRQQLQCQGASRVERPLDLHHASASVHPHVCMEAIPDPSLWDDRWLERVRAFSPQDLAVLHKQHTKRCAEMLGDALIRAVCWHAR